ncbi:hypothetical protein EW14_1493 [Prochlorococcus sp. MIT 0604]|nr:hypothetical protein EW14_1493 [Prochlorococcus sp. MIT 0604]
MNKVAVICHDAGGAEVLSHWLKRQKFLYCTVLEGPAKNVFIKNKCKISEEVLIHAIKKSDFIISGTSWQSDLEKKAIIKAREMGKYSITFLDHWSNYEERFLYKGQINLPNEIWVSDKYAYDLAKKLFKNTIIKRKRNYYFLNIKETIENKNFFYNDNRKTLKGLYIGENVSDHAFLATGDKNSYGYDEINSLKYLLENINNLNFNILSLKVRPHPSDSEGKYNFSMKNKLVKEISNNNELIDDILESDFIFGIDSMAMVIGLLANKKVISCISNRKLKCNLPFSEILYLRDLLEKRINL